jgi:hypothetical protein
MKGLGGLGGLEGLTGNFSYTFTLPGEGVTLETGRRGGSGVTLGSLGTLGWVRGDPSCGLPAGGQFSSTGPAPHLQEAPVDVVDDLHVARQQLLHQADRPALQRLGQHRVVGEGEDLHVGVGGGGASGGRASGRQGV